MNSYKRAISPTESHDNRPSKRIRKTSKNASNKVKKGKKHDRRYGSLPTTVPTADPIRHRTSDNEAALESDSQVPEHDAESDVECGIPLKDIKGAGRTIARCCDMFCDVNKAVHLVLLSKQEEQGESESEDEDRH